MSRTNPELIPILLRRACFSIEECAVSTEPGMLAYHLLVCIERAFLEQGIHTSWETLRKQLSTHQVVTVRLPTSDGPLQSGATPSQSKSIAISTRRSECPSAYCRQSNDGPKIVTEYARQPA